MSQGGQPSKDTKKGFTPLRRKPLHGNECRRQDLNLHSLVGNQALNLARLPIPPLRRMGCFRSLVPECSALQQSIPQSQGQVAARRTRVREISLYVDAAATSTLASMDGTVG